MIREMISKLVSGESLSREEAREVMNEIMSGEATPAQIGSYLTALSIKGATVDEVTGSAIVMREKASKIAELAVVGVIMIAIVLALVVPWQGRNAWDSATTNVVWKRINI